MNIADLNSMDFSNNFLEKGILSLQKSTQFKRLSYDIHGSLRSDLDGGDLEKALKDSG